MVLTGHRQGPAVYRWENVLDSRDGLHVYSNLIDYTYQAFYSEYRA